MDLCRLPFLCSSSPFLSRTPQGAHLLQALLSPTICCFLNFQWLHVSYKPKARSYPGIEGPIPHSLLCQPHRVIQVAISSSVPNILDAQLPFSMPSFPFKNLAIQTNQPRLTMGTRLSSSFLLPVPRFPFSLVSPGALLWSLHALL